MYVTRMNISIVQHSQPLMNCQVSQELKRLGAEGLLDPLAGTGSLGEKSKRHNGVYRFMCLLIFHTVAAIY